MEKYQNTLSRRSVSHLKAEMKYRNMISVITVNYTLLFPPEHGWNNDQCALVTAGWYCVKISADRLTELFVFNSILLLLLWVDHFLETELNIDVMRRTVSRSAPSCIHYSIYTGSCDWSASPAVLQLCGIEGLHGHLRWTQRAAGR